MGHPDLFGWWDAESLDAALKGVAEVVGRLLGQVLLLD
jgi:hypothetical protein